MERTAKVGLTVALIYLALAIGAIVFLAVMLTLHPEKAEFSGLYIIVLTLPWSIISTQLSEMKVISSLPGLIAMFSLFSIINTLVLYKFGKIIGKHW